MPGKSKKSIVISLRIPLDLLEAIDKRVKAQKILPETRNEYINRVLKTEVLRSHHRTKKELNLDGEVLTKRNG